MPGGGCLPACSSRSWYDGCMKVHFICRGNVFRSILAEAYLRSLKLEGIQVASSGTVADEEWARNQEYWGETLEFMHEHGLSEFAKPRAHQLTSERLEGSDVVVCMNEVVRQQAEALVKLPDDVLVWDVTDIGEPGRLASNRDERLALIKTVYGEIANNVDQLVDRLREKLL